MQVNRLTGPDAGSLKYDVLTMLSVTGLNGSPGLQTSMMRLMSLITARYNWRTDELSIGQREMARMWSVNERTVKREIKRLTEIGVLICKRPGVRGRVASYALNLPRIAMLSRDSWALVGTDFEDRMQGRYMPDAPKVVPLRTHNTQTITQEPVQGPWGRVQARLMAIRPDLYPAWFAGLVFVGFDLGVLRLKAPNRFVQRYIETHLIDPLTQIAAQDLGTIRRIEFETAPV